jgi:glutathione S-transferase
MRTLWIAAELGLDYTLIPLAWDDAQLKTPEFLAMNPAGAVPTITEDGVVVAESMAIALYLAKRHGGVGPEPLYPAHAQGEADVLRWSLWAQGQLEPWVQQDTRLATLRAGTAAAIADEIARSLGTLERALAARAWLAAEHFTVADLNVAGVLSPSRALHLPIADYPAVGDWLARCYGRPAARETRSRYA